MFLRGPSPLPTLASVLMDLGDGEAVSKSSKPQTLTEMANPSQGRLRKIAKPSFLVQL